MSTRRQHKHDPARIACLNLRVVDAITRAALSPASQPSLTADQRPTSSSQAITQYAKGTT
jgi:hypothetical protein